MLSSKAVLTDLINTVYFLAEPRSLQSRPTKVCFRAYMNFKCYFFQFQNIRSIQAKRFDEYVLKQHGSLFSFLRHDPLVHTCRPCCMINHTTPTNKTPRSPNNTSASIKDTDMIGSTTYCPRFQRGNPAVSNRLFS